MACLFISAKIGLFSNSTDYVNLGVTKAITSNYFINKINLDGCNIINNKYINENGVLVDYTNYPGTTIIEITTLQQGATYLYCGNGMVNGTSRSCAFYIVDNDNSTEHFMYSVSSNTIGKSHFTFKVPNGCNMVKLYTVRTAPVELYQIPSDITLNINEQILYNLIDFMGLNVNNKKEISGNIDRYSNKINIDEANIIDRYYINANGEIIQNNESCIIVLSNLIQNGRYAVINDKNGDFINLNERALVFKDSSENIIKTYVPRNYGNSSYEFIVPVNTSSVYISAYRGRKFHVYELPQDIDILKMEQYIDNLDNSYTLNVNYDIISGKYLTCENGNIIENPHTTWKCTNPILILPGFTYKWTVDLLNHPDFANSFIVNKNGDMGSVLYRGTGSFEYTSDTIQYIRITGYTTINVDIKISVCVDKKNELCDTIYKTLDYITDYKNTNTNADININTTVWDNLIADGGLTGIFKEIGIIGDSLSSGEMAYHTAVDETTTHYIDMYRYAWGKYMADICHSNSYIFGKGGLSTRTFFTEGPNSNNTPLENETRIFSQQVLSNDYKCQAYYIALGHNDYNEWKRNNNGLTLEQYVGNINDIDIEHLMFADTFYGRYAKIINTIKTSSPHAKIFCITMINSSLFNLFNEAIRYMPNIFNNIYIIDMNIKTVGSYPSWHYTQGHGNAMGYMQYGKAVATLTDEIIRNNYNLFKYVQFINTPEEIYIPNESENSIVL